METLILARHGESAYSALTLMNGDASVPVGLTPAGVEQARELGRELAGTALDLLVTSALPRAIETADESVGDREIPRVVIPDLNDPRYGVFEGKPLEDYRRWAAGEPSSERPPGGGESRREIVARYVRAFRELLARPEATILAVAHSLPIAYAVQAREGHDPGSFVPMVEYAKPFPFTAPELAAATGRLEGWLAEPAW